MLLVGIGFWLRGGFRLLMNIDINNLIFLRVNDDNLSSTVEVPVPGGIIGKQRLMFAPARRN